MSELNVYHHELRPDEYDEFYLKYEADKVIAEKDKEIKRQNTEIKNAVIDLKLRDKKNDELTIALKEKDKELRHHKYKRCLAMAKWCESEAYIHEYGSEYDEDLVAWFGKWYKRWLELAEKFKEAK